MSKFQSEVYGVFTARIETIESQLKEKQDSNSTEGKGVEYEHELQNLISHVQTTTERLDALDSDLNALVQKNKTESDSRFEALEERLRQTVDRTEVEHIKK